MSDRTIQVVTGYLQDIDYPCKAAEKLGLPFRYAVVFAESHSSLSDRLFELDMFKTLASGVGCESMTIHFQPNPVKPAMPVNSVEGFTASLKTMPEDDQEPFNFAHLRKGSNVVAYAEMEFWVRVGGLQPYSDSHTLSLYTPQNRSGDFLDACRSVCDAWGAEVASVRAGLDRPRVRWWRRFLNWVH